MEVSLGWELGIGWGCSTVGFSVQPPKAAEPGGLLGCNIGCSSAGDWRSSGVPLKLAQVALPISALNPSITELWVCMRGWYVAAKALGPELIHRGLSGG